MPAQLDYSSQRDRIHFSKMILKDDKIVIYYLVNEAGNESFAQDVEDGLTARAKYLLPKYFYDVRGSKLFEKITQVKEYYPTETETSILKNYVPSIYSACKKIAMIVELGSGSSVKTKIMIGEFLRNNDQIIYIPIDISNILIESSKRLLDEFPKLKISGIISDYEKGLSLVTEINKKPKLVIFLGSSIGNFDIPEIENFLDMIRESLNDDDFLLVGFDMDKDRKVLHAAYNDKQGITRDFNLNILNRINRELDADFNMDQFRHYAFFNEKKSRIEMHLVSKIDQMIKIGSLNRTIRFRQGETIHTENSYKFTREMIQNFAVKAGFSIVKKWSDPRRYFSLVLFKPI